MSAPRVLALDFDGVIWDSAGECFEVGWRAYKELFGSDLSGEANRAKFLAGRPLARTGHDFFLLLRLLEGQPDLDLSTFSPAEFLTLRQQWAEEAAQFNVLFYQLRAKYRDEDFDAWASWQGAYPEMIALLDRWQDRFVGVAIATTKDAASAHALLQSVGRDWPIFGKEFSVDKSLQIAGIAEEFKVEPAEILFIDDLLENLQQVAPTGAQSAMAAWGYNTEDLKEEARTLGYRVLGTHELDIALREALGEVPA